MSAPLARVPCTIVTGFLGAGKTTLIRHVLENANGRRLAVIVNEFGDVGIDGEILKGCGVDTCPEENIVELANGCICCTVADDFVPALDQILAREPRVEHIVIETSGLALPKPLVQAFHWPAIKSRVTVDGVVAVVDGAALAEGRVADDLAALAAQRAADNALDHDDPIEEVFEDQIACADLMILNKSDLMTRPASPRRWRRSQAHCRAPCKIVTSPRARSIPRVLLGLGVGAEDDIENRKTHHDDESTTTMTTSTPSSSTCRRSPIPPQAGDERVAERRGARRVAHEGLRRGRRQADAAVGAGRRPARQPSLRPAWAPTRRARGRLVVIGLEGARPRGRRQALTRS